MSHAPQGRWSRFCVSVFRLWFVTLPLLSIGLLPTPSYDKRIKGAETIKAETSELFGDKTNLATGETEFLVTDVSIPGNNALPVAIERQFSVEAKGGKTGREFNLFVGHAQILTYLCLKIEMLMP